MKRYLKEARNSALTKVYNMFVETIVHSITPSRQVEIVLKTFIRETPMAGYIKKIVFAVLDSPVMCSRAYTLMWSNKCSDLFENLFDEYPSLYEDYLDGLDDPETELEGLYGEIGATWREYVKLD